jgi:hypothetical protein
VLQQTEAEYIWIQGGVPTPSSIVSSTNVKITIEDMTDRLKKAFTSETPKKSAGCWNIDKRAKYKATSRCCTRLLSVLTRLMKNTLRTSLVLRKSGRALRPSTLKYDPRL